MAEDLSISASYLNLLERNQRPLTAQLLLRLAEAYDLDLRSLTAGDNAALGMDEIFSDPIFKDLGVSRHEIAELADNAPTAAEAIVRLYSAYVNRGRLLDLQSLERPDSTSTGVSPNEWVRDFIHANKNHFPEIEEAGASLARLLAAGPQDFSTIAGARLKERFGVDVRTVSADLLQDNVRFFDRHKRRLLLSEILTGASRNFALAYHLFLLEYRTLVDQLAARAAPPDATTRNLLIVSFANYAAGAVLMPYEPFYQAVEEMRYDISRLRTRFGVSHEQACHRLTTLARPGARAVPFFMLRIDAAGNISKRFASGSFPFSRFGGTCPRWNIHESFRMPGRFITQVIETPDGERYFTISRTVRRVTSPAPGDSDELAIGLGCELKYAHKLIYSRGLNIENPAAVAVGPSCRICERQVCPQRAAPPVAGTLAINDFNKSISPYPFTPS